VIRSREALSFLQEVKNTIEEKAKNNKILSFIFIRFGVLIVQTKKEKIILRTQPAGKWKIHAGKDKVPGASSI